MGISRDRGLFELGCTAEFAAPGAELRLLTKDDAAEQVEVERNLRVIRTESNLMGNEDALVLQVSQKPFDLLLTNCSPRRTAYTAGSSSLRASVL